jgi:transposase-like protein
MERTVSSNLVPKKDDETFRRQAVEMVLRGGKTVKPAADALGVSPYSIYEWKRKLLPTALAVGSAGQTAAAAGLPDEVARLQKLIPEQPRQIAELTLQREVLSLNRAMFFLR